MSYFQLVQRITAAELLACPSCQSLVSDKRTSAISGRCKHRNTGASTGIDRNTGGSRRNAPEYTVCVNVYDVCVCSVWLYFVFNVSRTNYTKNMFVVFESRSRRMAAAILDRLAPRDLTIAV